uniref:PPM-type phosphatase domain-containing protein n=1 Tax=Macrostomum lignano TaxID=282301 RepID=A0A1I8F3U3_9PLAT
SRLLATIGVARGFGDHDLLVSDSSIAVKPFLSCVPQVVPLHDCIGADDFVVMATDGLWDVLSNEAADAVVKDAVSASSPHKLWLARPGAPGSGSQTPDSRQSGGFWRLTISDATAAPDDSQAKEAANGNRESEPPASLDDISCFVIPLGWLSKPPTPAEHYSVRGLQRLLQADAKPLPILPHEVPDGMKREEAVSAPRSAKRLPPLQPPLCRGRRRLHGFQRHRRVSRQQRGGAGGLSFGDPNTPASVGGASGVRRLAPANGEHGIDKILNAELALEPPMSSYVDATDNPVSRICQAADKQLMALVNWAKQLPHFCELPLEDQVVLIKSSWNELLIASFSYRSTVVSTCIAMVAKEHGVGAIFDRILVELVQKMREMRMDRTELGCLKAIVLSLTARPLVEQVRDKLYLALEEYCRNAYPDESGRFSRLLLRLPALRSIGLKTLEHLFFFQLVGQTPEDSFLAEMLAEP